MYSDTSVVPISTMGELEQHEKMFHGFLLA